MSAEQTLYWPWAAGKHGRGKGFNSAAAGHHLGFAGKPANDAPVRALIIVDEWNV
ncbi:hypothetical protein BD310DRAFT_923277 [Dichomitus squalens]|uniref:Uncharacterized protein n=1 Tax=Dichomitus squalens TaxID=114155 RepID=A0A4Q9Q0I6_9APHY|nr:hypothetical protein BD310DRAFT_923277 [Dichomitus squalens]